MALLHVDRRLPSWSAAVGAARPCVGKESWRAPNIGGRRSILTTRHKVHGLFINYIDHRRPHLFARPSTMSIDAMLDFLHGDERKRGWPSWWVLDHSNGLLLTHMGSGKLSVCNPATRRWTFIPWEWRPVGGKYLAFDPAVSPHYQVLVIPAVPEPEPEKQPAKRSHWKGGENEKPPPTTSYVDNHDTRILMESEWPPTPWTLSMFSSRTGRWEEINFDRLGEPAGTVGDMLVDRVNAAFGCLRQRYAVYWQGALYVHCRGSFVVRLSLSDRSYQVIKTPSYGENRIFVKPYLGRSEKGVYFGIIEGSQLRVWILSELSEQRMEWILTHQHDLARHAQHVRKYDRQMNTPWMVHDVSDTDHKDAHVAAKTLSEERFDWDSDNDDFFTVKFDADEYPNFFSILGFHPYKEVVFLDGTFGVVSYNLKNLKVQYLGDSRPKSYTPGHSNGIYESFVYSPCMIGEFNEGDNQQTSS